MSKPVGAFTVTRAVATDAAAISALNHAVQAVHAAALPWRFKTPPKVGITEPLNIISDCFALHMALAWASVSLAEGGIEAIAGLPDRTISTIGHKILGDIHG